jgi:hypothetical protein
MLPKNWQSGAMYPSTGGAAKAAVPDKAGPVRSTIHQSIEITNGNFTYRIASDGEFIKIERVGDGNAQRQTGGFFLIPIEMWDEVVNFVFLESQRRKADAE